VGKKVFGLRAFVLRGVSLERGCLNVFIADVNVIYRVTLLSLRISSGMWCYSNSILWHANSEVV